MKNLFVNAKYDFEIHKEFHADFKLIYIVEVRNYCKGKLRIFLSSFIEKPSDHYKNGRVYLGKEAVDYILSEIEYFKENKKWK